jgi:hypothetical protein
VVKEVERLFLGDELPSIFNTSFSEILLVVLTRFLLSSIEGLMGLMEE